MFNEINKASSLSVVGVFFLVYSFLTFSLNSLGGYVSIGGSGLILYELVFSITSCTLLLKFGNTIGRSTIYSYDELPVRKEFYQGF